MIKTLHIKFNMYLSKYKLNVINANRKKETQSLELHLIFVKKNA